MLAGTAASIILGYGSPKFAMMALNDSLSLVSRGLYWSSSPTVVTCCKFTYLNTFPRKSIILESAISQQSFISFTTQQLVQKVPMFWIKKT
jgi:hypothetical protein